MGLIIASFYITTPADFQQGVDPLGRILKRKLKILSV
jgi:hypothetical protein